MITFDSFLDWNGERALLLLHNGFFIFREGHVEATSQCLHQILLYLQWH